MHFKSNIYKYAELDPVMHEQLKDESFTGALPGYFLIDGKLVPESLVARIKDYLGGITFEYGYVWSIEELLGEEFWVSLDAFEKSVAGACVLIIIERGYPI